MNKHDTVLAIQLTPLNNGDPDLYVSFGSDDYPTLAAYDWYSDNLRGEYL